MLNKLELKKLPFVDTCPEPDQKRIPWVRNNDCLTGASTKYGNDGSLNGAGVGIFTDVLTLEENSVSTQDVLNKVIDNVNNINEALEVGADVDVIRQIAQNKENIEILQVHMQFAEDNIGELETSTEFIKEDLGVFDPNKDTLYRPVRNELLFLKTEIGAYPGQDFNGLPNPGADSTGMKRRIINNTSAIVDATNRIQKLEDDYQDSDVGSLSIKINEIRDELGPQDEVNDKPPVYTRLDSLDTLTTEHDDTINRISTAISLDVGPSINSRVNGLETRTTTVENTLNFPITGIVPRVTKIETDIGKNDIPTSINGRITTLRTDHDALSFIVGKDSGSGLRGQVATLTQTIGADNVPTSIQGRLKIVETRSISTAVAVQDLQAEIGGNNTGLKGTVLKHTSQIDGKNPNGSTVEERGLVISVKQLETSMMNKIEEAPEDGEAYVRKDGAWVLLSDFLTP